MWVGIFLYAFCCISSAFAFVFGMWIHKFDEEPYNLYIIMQKAETELWVGLVLSALICLCIGPFMSVFWLIPVSCVCHYALGVLISWIGESKKRDD